MSAQQDKQYPYHYQARVLLQNTFPKVSCAAIDAIQAANDKFLDAYNSLTNIASGQSQLGIPSIKVFIKQKRSVRALQLTDPTLLAEIADIPELNTKQNCTATKATAEVEARDDGDAKGQEINVETLECLCCYGDHPIQELMECSAGSGHFVCRECINRFVSEQLDGNHSVIFNCIVDANCGHKYSNEMLDQDGVLSPKLKCRMNDRVFREMLKSASLGNEWTCPKCAYVGFVEGDLPAWINCPAECKNVKYCTSCNELWHRGKTCEEAHKANALKQDPKLRAQEAMSQATKRSCPHCNQEFLKSDGCNGIRCKCDGLNLFLVSM